MSFSNNSLALSEKGGKSNGAENFSLREQRAVNFLQDHHHQAVIGQQDVFVQWFGQCGQFGQFGHNNQAMTTLILDEARRLVFGSKTIFLLTNFTLETQVDDDDDDDDDDDGDADVEEDGNDDDDDDDIDEVGTMQVDQVENGELVTAGRQGETQIEFSS